MNIELRKWNTDYREELIRICNTVDRSYLSNRMPNPYTEADADWWLGMVAKHDEKDGIFRAVYVDGLLAGTVSVEQKTDVHCKDGEIGYYLSTDYWRRGIMTEAVEKVCLLAFEILDIVRITGLTYEPNKSSQRVLEKNGFVREGIQRQAVYKDGKFYDLYLYGKLRS